MTKSLLFTKEKAIRLVCFAIKIELPVPSPEEGGWTPGRASGPKGLRFENAVKGTAPSNSLKVKRAMTLNLVHPLKGEVVLKISRNRLNLQK